MTHVTPRGIGPFAAWCMHSSCHSRCPARCDVLHVAFRPPPSSDCQCCMHRACRLPDAGCQAGCLQPLTGSCTCLQLACMAHFRSASLSHLAAACRSRDASSAAAANSPAASSAQAAPSAMAVDNAGWAEDLEQACSGVATELLPAIRQQLGLGRQVRRPAHSM